MVVGKKDYIFKIISVITILLIIAMPFIRAGYIIRFLTTIFMYVALAQVWNILGGFAGYISLGLAAFVGVGAYATGILMSSYGFNFYIAALISALFSGLIALLIGLPVLRLKSGYFSIATFGIAFILREIANNMTSVTGGGMGLSFPLLSIGIDGFNRYFYYLMLIISVLTTLACMRIYNSKLGYGLQAIKEDEEAANVLGVNTTIYKVVAFVISGFLAALVGAIYGYWLTFIDPASAFDSDLSILVIIMAMIGGTGTVLGPIIGAISISYYQNSFGITLFRYIKVSWVYC